MKKIMWLLVFLILNFTALRIGVLLMNNGPTTNWYLQLNKAPWTPPGWFFGVAWTTIMICFSIYLSYLVKVAPIKTFWIIFFIQFILNIAWNYIFFNQHQIAFGLLNIVLLLLVIGYYLVNFYKDVGLKTWFIVPYFVWLFVATSLNAYAYFKN